MKGMVCEQGTMVTVKHPGECGSRKGKGARLCSARECLAFIFTLDELIWC